MTNSKLLYEIIARRGIKLDHLRKALDISYHTLRRKLNNQSSFTAGEIDILCEVLDIRDLELKERLFFYK
jgi:DNA-binding Xre family transcriptional regulator